MIRLAPALTFLLLFGLVGAGLLGAILPAFGLLPALGGTTLTLQPFRDLVQVPGVGTAAALSFSTGLLATLVSVALVAGFVAAAHGTRAFRIAARLASPVLALPHSAAAFALAFLVAPSGLLFRLAAGPLGFDRPPDLLIVNDPAGLALVAGLVLKEAPFLFVMTLAALPQTDAARSAMVAAGLGYSRVSAFLLAVWPRLYRQIRLPAYAVLAFSTSVVDVSMILGPTTPPTLAMLVLDRLGDPDLSRRFEAAAGIIVQLGVSAAAALAYFGVERSVGALLQRLSASGRRGRGDTIVAAASFGLSGLLALGLALGLALLGVWSVAGPWRFPSLLPDGLRLDGWARAADSLPGALSTGVTLGLLACAIALCLAILTLEAETRRGRRYASAPLLYLPLVVPQVGFLFGLQVLALLLGGLGTFSAVLVAHLVFVLPYVFLSLGPAWRALDPRYARSAAALGASPVRVLLAVRLPLLLRPLATAAALGFAVSAALYLPTQMLGAGRVTTVTTEAVALASGGDRKAIGAFALVQTALPALGFLAAALLPALVYRNRAALR